MKGVVIRSTGSWYNVQLEENDEIIPCRIQGKFRLDGFKVTNPLAVGDHVVVDTRDNMIVEILPRKNYVVRQSPRKKHQLHLMASNIDQACLVITIVQPRIKPGFIDRFLLMTEPYDIPVIIVVNKSDLLNKKKWQKFDELQQIYSEIGYEMKLISAKSGEGLEDLKILFRNKITLIAGQSGVGKSSILNAIHDELNLRTKELSDYTGKGQHTTTFAEMIPLSTGGQIIDTPGIKTLSFNHLEVMDVAHNFREFFKYSKECKYRDCTHRNEPHCAIKEAVEEGFISEYRYGNYLKILYEIEQQNYWERNLEY